MSSSLCPKSILCSALLQTHRPLILPSVEAEDNGPEWADGFRGSHFPQLCSVGADIELQLQRSPKGE